MDTKNLIEFFNINLKKNLTPNGWYLLYCISNKIKINEIINLELEKRKLFNSNFLNQDGTLSKTGLEMLGIRNSEVITKDEFINSYRNLFPAGKIWGYYKRDSILDLRERFSKFFKAYNFSYDLILKATKKYIEEEKGNENWRYLKGAAYVIEKRGEPCLLAKLCEGYNEEDSNYGNFKDFTNS